MSTLHSARPAWPPAGSTSKLHSIIAGLDADLPKYSAAMRIIQHSSVFPTHIVPTDVRVISGIPILIALTLLLYRYRHDWARTGRFALIGLTCHGPFFFKGFSALDSFYGPSRDLRTALLKTMTGQVRNAHGAWMRRLGLRLRCPPGGCADR